MPCTCGALSCLHSVGVERNDGYLENLRARHGIDPTNVGAKQGGAVLASVSHGELKDCLVLVRLGTLDVDGLGSVTSDVLCDFHEAIVTLPTDRINPKSEKSENTLRVWGKTGFPVCLS